MSGALALCPSCSRHVKVDEKVCPFCAEALPTDLALRAAPAADVQLRRKDAVRFVAAATRRKPKTPKKTKPTTPRKKTKPTRKQPGRKTDIGSPAPPYGSPPDRRTTKRTTKAKPTRTPGSIAQPYGSPPDGRRKKPQRRA